MSKIRVLSDQLANQIAAGEVVERPASVVKELVENSLDAGARRIAVDIESGGRRLLRIADDGEGMSRDDAVLAFERHATSKLKTVEDLMRIVTLGFRGEALASIAAVARVELTTKTDGDKAATRVVIEGGRVRDVRDAAHTRGTTFTVRDLFFNVPARRKFLRSEATETYHIVNLVTHYALAHPEAAFILTNNGRETLRCNAARDVKERAYQLFGAQFIESLLEVNGGHEQIAVVRGYVSSPSERRTSREAQYLFVNNRFVRDKVLAKALTDAYRGLLPTGSHAAALLFLDMPLEEVDVNVHPAKTEVRFRRASAVGDAVRDAIRDTLARNGYARAGGENDERVDFSASQELEVDRQLDESIAGYGTQGVMEFGAETPDVRCQIPDADEVPEPDARRRIPDADETSRLDAGRQTPEADEISRLDAGQDFLAKAAQQNKVAGEREPAAVTTNNDAQAVVGEQELANTTDITDPQAVIVAEKTLVAEKATEAQMIAGAQETSVATEVTDAQESGIGNLASGITDLDPTLPPSVSVSHLMREVPVEALSANIRPLGQLEESYLIATDDEGLLLVDQHIAHERILFNRYRRREDTRPLESQRLLIPETFDLTPAQAVVFGSVETELEKCGFELMRLSGRTVAIKAVPADLPAREARALLAEILDTIERERRGSAQKDWRDHIAAKLACRAAVKAHTKLAPEKMRWLIDRLLQTDAPTTGPHGRPGILRLTLRDIEKGLQRS